MIYAIKTFCILDNQITQKLNEKLTEACRQFQIPVVDVYHDYADSTGILNSKLSDGNVHINHAFNHAIEVQLLKMIDTTIITHQNKYLGSFRSGAIRRIAPFFLCFWRDSQNRATFCYFCGAILIISGKF